MQSSLSSDSCEYYQTEIYDQLPSVQASRSGHESQGTLERRNVGPESGDNVNRGPLPRPLKDKESTLPIRNLTMCIQAKRDARDRRKLQTRNIGSWASWRQSQSISRKRVWEHVCGALSHLIPWQHTLHAIEGRFGVGMKAYFVFLRYLVYLNLLHCLLIGGFILGPTAIYGRSIDIESLRFGSNDSVLDFFLGTGYLDRSPVFFGFYTPSTQKSGCVSTPLLYLAGIFSILLFSLILEVRRTTVGYKHTWMLGKRYSVNVTYKIFCGWDFAIQDPGSATLKQGFIRNDLKLFLEEQSFSQRAAQRTLGQKVRLYLFRFVLNVTVLCLLAGAFFLIYFATLTSQNESGHHWLVSLFLQYLPPITITAVNLFLPHVFRKISSFEDYSFTTQVNATLVRSIFLKLASLGIYLFFVFRTVESQHCRENKFGREMYKLCIFNFLTTFCATFFLNYPRMLLWQKYPSSLIARWVGRQSFLIPFNVLDLVYSQTVSWVGLYYCPLLPLIVTVTLTATFYIKKFTVLRCCMAEQRMFRGSNTSVLFHFMLLLGLLMASVVLGFYFNPHVVHGARNVTSCGLFEGGETVFSVMGECVENLPVLMQTTLYYLTSEAFALPLILAEIIILTSFVSRGRANRKAIERLKDMLVMSSSDKRFLVKQHATMLRQQRHKLRVRSAAPHARGKSSASS